MLGHVDRNIFNVISGGFGTAQVAPAAGGDAPAGVHAETTADSVAQKMLMAKVCVCVGSSVARIALYGMQGSTWLEVCCHEHVIRSWLEACCHEHVM